MDPHLDGDRPWESTTSPARILLMRLHATGDVALTLSASLGVRRRFPNARIDYLTTQSNGQLFDATTICDTVHLVSDNFHPLDGRLVRRLRAGRHDLGVLLRATQLRTSRYDVVIDLQNNVASRRALRILDPPAWARFDRFSPLPAEQRTLDTIGRAGFKNCQPLYDAAVKETYLLRARSLLESSGWQNESPLIVLNPAGLWPTRHWPLERYVQVAKALMEERDVQFVVLGTSRIEESARHLAEHLGASLINLVNRTSLGTALAVLRLASAALTEDSGLAAMAVSIGTPTLLLLGSTRHDWTTPIGPHTRCLHSGDLDCGSCMQSTCRHGDVRCLTRYSPATVHDILRELLCDRRSNRSFVKHE